MSGNPEPVHPPMQRHRVICVYLEQRKEEEKKLDDRNEITSYDSSLNRNDNILLLNFKRLNSL